MINITQLRVGNLITPTIMGSTHEPTPMTLVILNAWTRIGDLENWVGSEITGEWLLKLGFTLKSNYHPEGENYEFKSDEGFTFEVCPAYCMVDIVQNIGRIRIKSIKYLHQLQNLYYSTTGGELNFNPPPE